MIFQKLSFAATLAIAVLCSLTTEAQADPAAALSLGSAAVPAAFRSGAAFPSNLERADRYDLTVENRGAAATRPDEPIVITDTLPPGLVVKKVELPLPSIKPNRELVDFAPAACDTGTSGESETVTCVIDETLTEAFEPGLLWPSELLEVLIYVETPPSVSGELVNSARVEGGGGGKATTTSRNEANESGEAHAGLQRFVAALIDEDGAPANDADSHPYSYTTSFAVNSKLPSQQQGGEALLLPAEGSLKDIEVKAPPGLTGASALTQTQSRCTAQQFNTTRGVTSERGGSLFINECPDASAIGLIAVNMTERGFGVVAEPVYNLVPPKGMPAQFGFEIAGAPFYLKISLRSDGDYGVSARFINAPEAKRVMGATVTLWGVPGDPSHDRLRGHCLNPTPPLSLGSCAATGGDPSKPFLRLPSSCDSPLTTSMLFSIWPNPGAFAAGTSSVEPAPEGCNLPPFAPTIEARPSTVVADAPTGLHFDLHLPQAENEAPKGLGEADLRDARVTLPPGLLVNPSSADGLGACSLSQIGFQGMQEGRPSFSARPAECPDAAKVGTVQVASPLVDHLLPGAVYLAQPHENPFDSLIAIYIAIADPQTGVVVKLAGEVKPDPVTGQLTTTVLQNPQLPFEDFEFDFFKGARAPLRTPAVCGQYTTTTSLIPWTAPASGPAATPFDSFVTTTSPSGGSCATSAGQLPNAPRFEAGSQNPLAGAYSPFLLRLSRQDGSQELKGLNLTLPPGISAKLAGVAECSEGALTTAEHKSGREEQAAPSCPAASHLGTVTVGAGAGPSPYYARGDVYLGGPYKGAPLSMAVVTPAVAGPFDLGTVVVKAPLNVDPETAQGSVKSEFPTVLQGIPLDVRSVAVSIDRSQFTLNPTSCEAKEVIGEAISVQGQSIPLQNRFQVGGCGSLKFKPKVSLRLKGGTKRSAFPALKAVVTYPNGGAYANTAKASVALPHSEFLEQSHFRTICTRVQFAAEACPQGAIYGKVRAFTPLLDQPLEGPVYLRSSSNPLPDLVLDLRGQIHVVSVARVDSHNGGIRSRFEAIPDAPISKVVLEMQGGKKGLFVNSRDICKHVNRATAKLVAHNGKVSSSRPELKAQCRQKKKTKRHRYR